MAENSEKVALNDINNSPSKGGYNQLTNNASDDESLAESHGPKEEGTSGAYTLMFIIRVFVGTGILSMADAFKDLGLFFGFVIVFICWSVMTYSLYLLVAAAEVVERKTKKPELGYGEVLEESFLLGPKCLRKFSTSALYFLNGIIVAMQFGCCCVYMVFIADNIKQVFDEYLHISWPNSRYLLILSPLFLLMALMRKIEVLSKFSVFGNVVFAIGYIIVMQYVCRNLPTMDEVPWITPISEWPKGFATAVFAFEGICLILPLRNKMRRKEEFMGCNGVLMTSMYLILILYLALGFYGFLRFGSVTAATITLNLPHEPLYITLKILLPLVIFVTFSMQFFVIIEICFPFFGQKLAKQGRSELVWEYVFRTCLAIVMLIFAIVVPMLGTLIDIVGATFGLNLSITIPNIIILLVRYSESDLGFLKWRVPFHILLTVFGIFTSVVGTYSTILSAVETHPGVRFHSSLATPAPSST